MKHDSLASDTNFKYSKGLAEWLSRLEISLILTCYHTGQLIVIGVKPSGELSFCEINLGYVTGLYCDTQQIYVSTFNQIIHFQNVLKNGDSNKEDHDALFLPKAFYNVGNVDIHELNIDNQGNPIFVNTCYSCIAKLHPVDSFELLWLPPFISALVPEHRCHLNGMCVVNGIPTYATAISSADEFDGWRGRRTETGVLMDLRSNDIVINGLSMPHSPRMYNESLWLLESGKGQLLKIDANSYATENVCFCNGFLRGMDFYDKYAIVGMSLGRDDGFAGLAIDNELKKHNMEPSCGFAIIDIEQGKMIEWLHFEGLIRELFEIKVMPKIKHPHLNPPHKHYQNTRTLFPQEIVVVP